MLGIRAGTPRISADGKIIAATVLSDDNLIATAAKWTAASGWQVLANLGPVPSGMAPIDNSDSSVFAMSANGKVIGDLYWLGDSWRAHAMRWTAANGMEDAGSSGRNSRINAMNADGTVMVGWDEHPDYGNWRATVWVRACARCSRTATGSPRPPRSTATARSSSARRPTTPTPTR